MKTIFNKIKKTMLSLSSAIRFGMRFLEGKNFLVCVVVINLIFIFSWIALYFRENTVMWTVALGFPFVSTVACFAWYAQEILAWCQIHKHHGIKKALSVICSGIIVLAPVISFFVATSLAKLYYENHLSTIDIVGCCLLVVSQFVLILFYCVELKDTVQPKYTPAFRAKYFVACVVHIAQLFADAYIILFVFFPDSFTGIDASSAFSIAFDFTYFSTMTLLTAGSEIIAVSRLAKSFVLIETFLFVIVISMVIFGIFSNDTAVTCADELNTDSVSPKSVCEPSKDVKTKNKSSSSRRQKRKNKKRG